MKNIECKNEEQLDAMKDHGEKQLDVIKNYGAKKELESSDEKNQRLIELINKIKKVNEKLIIRRFCVHNQMEDSTTLMVLQE